MKKAFNQFSLLDERKNSNSNLTSLVQTRDTYDEINDELLSPAIASPGKKPILMKAPAPQPFSSADFNISCRKLSVIKESVLELGEEENLGLKKASSKTKAQQNDKTIFSGFQQAKKQIDDVYDVKAFLENHELYTLREGNVLNQMALMNLQTASLGNQSSHKSRYRMNIPDIN